MTGHLKRAGLGGDRLAETSNLQGHVSRSLGFQLGKMRPYVDLDCLSSNALTNAVYTCGGLALAGVRLMTAPGLTRLRHAMGSTMYLGTCLVSIWKVPCVRIVSQPLLC